MKTAKKRPPLTRDQQRLVEANLGIARAVARRMLRKGGLYARCDPDTLASAAYEGLCDAAPRFDPTRGVAFGTYADYHCVQRCQVAASAAGAVTLPRTLVQGQSSERTRRIARRVTSPARLDRRGPDGEVLLQAAGREPDPSEASADAEDLDRLLSRLMPREREVLVLHHVHGMTLEEVGAAMGFTRSRAQQIEAVGVARLRGEPTQRTSQQRKRKGATR